MTHSITFWVGFHVVVLFLLTLDLAFFHRKRKHETIQSAIGWSLFWILLALGFNLFLYFSRGSEEALLFFTGYVIEKTLSVDNIFVFLMIFSFFRIPRDDQRKILYWGILGALVMRISMILLGVYLLEKYHFVFYILGVFLCFTAVQFFRQDKKKLELEKNFLFRLCEKFLPITSDRKDGHFFLRKSGKLYATPLFLSLLLIESTDVVFALDSIPAILAITTDPFIAYTSNVFAILGLRSLYFVLAHFQGRFQHFNKGIAVILFFIGVKMLISSYYSIPVLASLAFIVATLVVTIWTSFALKPQKNR